MTILSAIRPSGAVERTRERGAETPALVRLDGVAKSYGTAARAHSALSDVSLKIPERGLVALLGRSGSGKSTLLRMIAGLIEPSAGTILVDGQPVVGPPPIARYVFQDYGESLFPWMRARENVLFGIRHAPTRIDNPRAQAEHYLERVGLGDAADRYPWELSGGMQQRLAIARALASRPRLLLMDEPFGAVDALSRARLQDLLLQLWTDLDLTVVLVTHDIDEAVYLAQRVIVLDPAGEGVRAELDIDLDQSRTQLAAREDPRFARYRRELHKLVLE